MWLAGFWRPHTTTDLLTARGFVNFAQIPSVSVDIADNINYLELIAACVAIFAWAETFCGKEVVIVSDNSSTVSFLNKGTTKNEEVLRWLKRF